MDVGGGTKTLDTGTDSGGSAGEQQLLRRILTGIGLGIPFELVRVGLLPHFPVVALSVLGLLLGATLLYLARLARKRRTSGSPGGPPPGWEAWLLGVGLALLGWSTALYLLDLGGAPLWIVTRILGAALITTVFCVGKWKWDPDAPKDRFEHWLTTFATVSACFLFLEIAAHTRS